MKRVLSGALVILGALSAQPTCNQCSATYIAASEMEAYKQKAIANRIIDQQGRAVDIGKAHVGIGMVYRGKLDKPQNSSVAEQDEVSEFFHIIDGSAPLVTG